MNKLAIGDAENAFIQLAIAIDGTAKRLYPGQRTTDRCKRFLKEVLPFVLWSLTNGTPARPSDLSFQFGGTGLPNSSTKFEELVYRIIRCALLHEGEMPAKVEFVHASYIGMLGGKMQFPVALIGALLLAVIASSVNAQEKVSPSSAFTFGNTIEPVEKPHRNYLERNMKNMTLPDALYSTIGALGWVNVLSIFPVFEFNLVFLQPR